ncbi:MAG: hypothetical protein M5U31_07140 [Acidimicrobiia bacterium]|nr:hypothetical protein [Acidimicrobiia bacterium]
MPENQSDNSLEAAADAVALSSRLVDTAAVNLAEASSDGDRISVAKLDEHQVLAYDLAHAASAVEGCRAMLAYAEKGDLESRLARAFVADAVADLGAKMLGREGVWGVDASGPRVRAAVRGGAPRPGLPRRDRRRLRHRGDGPDASRR